LCALPGRTSFLGGGIMESTHSDFRRGDRRRCPFCFEEIHAEAVKCRHCKSALSPGPRAVPPRGNHGPWPHMLLGVCSWLSTRYRVPVALVRVLFILAVFFHGFGILLYLALWAVLPACEDRPSRVGAGIQALKRVLLAVKRTFVEEVSDIRGRGTGAAEPGGEVQGPGPDSR